MHWCKHLRGCDDEQADHGETHNVNPEEIPLLVPDLPRAEELLPYLHRIDRSRWYSNFGQLVGELEAKLSRLAGNERLPACATVANCSLGLELALAAMGLPRGGRVLIPALTFVATAGSVLRAGLTPVVGDVREDTWLLTPDIARAALRSLQIACVIPVATFGCPQDADAWDSFSSQTSVPVLVDAAGAIGNQRVGVRTSCVFSLHATKTLGAGEGGFIASHDRELVERVRRLSNFGIDPVTGIVGTAGTNAKMSEYHAAVALAALDAWPEQAELRRRLARYYCNTLSDYCPEVRMQVRPTAGVYSIFPVILPEHAEPAFVAQRLARKRIGSRRWYFPLVHEHPAFRESIRADALATSSRLSGRIIGLPFHSFLTELQIQSVCRALGEAIGS